MKSGRPKRFAQSLSVNFALVAFVPLFIVSLLLVTYLRIATFKEAESKNLLLARSVGAQVEVFLREPLAVLQNIRGTLLAERELAGEDLESALVTHVRHSELFESIYLLGPDGRVSTAGLQQNLSAYRGDYLGLDLSHKDYYRRARETGEPTWSEASLSLLTGKTSVALCLRVDDRTLVGNFNIDILSYFSRRLHIQDRITVMIVDGHGNVIVHPDPVIAGRKLNVIRLEPIREAVEGGEGTHRYRFEGEDFLGSVASVPGPGWFALVSQRSGDIYSPIINATLILSLGLLVTALLAVPAALAMARRFSRPLLDFARQAKEIAAGGEYDLPVSDVGILEISEMASSFRKMAEAVGERESRLVESEEKYRILFENANDAIFISQDGRIPFANPPTEEMTGRNAEQLARHPFADIIHPEDRKMVVDRHQRRLAGDDVERNYTFRIVHTDGRTTWAFINSILIDWEGRPATLNFIRDITEQKSFEMQALQAQKLEAIGTLAGGIAHDFNNLLQAIQGYAEICLMQGGEDSPLREDLHEIVQAAQRGGELTRQLLLFSRKVDSRMRAVDLNEQVRRTAKILERILPRMIEIRLNLDARLSMVEADPSQVEQVLMNLVVNSRDAMPDGGTLTIETKTLFLVAAGVEHPVSEPGDYVLLSVTDTGSGITPEDQEHIFEPFYTTKEAGRGTGLGLAMAYGIIRNHKGSIACLSTPGEGTTFKVYLPALSGPEVSVDAEVVEVPKGGDETILFVDDEKPVLEIGEKILTTFGYEVLRAESGEAALEIFRSRRNDIDLVILDMIMPGMGGMHCLHELRRLDEKVRILVASGFAGGGTAREVIEAGALGLVRKPYAVNQLLRVVKAAIEGTLQ